jgi:haloacetate dehalogenase
LLGERGAVHRLFDARALWRAQCDANVTVAVMQSGHFIPETLPEETATALLTFFT